MPGTLPKIVIVVSNLEFGGAQQQIVELVNRLDGGEFEMHLVSLSDFMPLADNLTVPGDRIHLVEKRWKYDLTVPLRLARLLRRLGADLVHGFLFDAEIAARVGGAMARTPVVVGSERNCDYTIKRVQKLFYRLTKAWQHASIANSHAGAAFNGRELGYPPGHYRVVHNGVNTGRFRPGSGAGLRAQLGLDDENTVIGMFGSFKEQKNHRLWFRVAADLLREHRECRFLLVGDQLHGGMHGSDEYKLGLDRLVDDLGIREFCRFVGNQPHVEEYYRACDLTVLPSLHEGMPNVVLESLASGVPVVATDVADNAMLIAHERVGLLVPSQDEAALGGAIRRLLDDGELRRRYGEEAVRWIAGNFSAGAMARKTAEVYSALLDTAQPSRAG